MGVDALAPVKCRVNERSRVGNPATIFIYGAAHQSHRVSRAVRPERAYNMLIAAFHANAAPPNKTDCKASVSYWLGRC